MLEGVKALFKFTMAILYLAFQITPPSSCEVFSTIRNTAREMYDVKLLLSIVEQIKLPKNSYFAIRRSFYIVQSSFNSDEFHMNSLLNDSGRKMVVARPLNVQQLPTTKPPALSLITDASLVAQQSYGGSRLGSSLIANPICARGLIGPRVCVSPNKSKVCVQNLGRLGRSHIRIIDANDGTNERSLMNPLRNGMIIGIADCGKKLVVARQSSKRSFKTFVEQEIVYNIHEVATEVFDGFYLHDKQLVLILTHNGELIKVDASRCFTDQVVGNAEILMLKDCPSLGDHRKIKLSLASLDVETNLLWIYIECEEKKGNFNASYGNSNIGEYVSRLAQDEDLTGEKLPSRNEENLVQQSIELRPTLQRKILTVDVATFDVFSAFSVPPSLGGEITRIRTSFVAFCQLTNPMSNQFSTRIVQVSPGGRYNRLLSLSDVVDFMITVPQEYSPKRENTCDATVSIDNNCSIFKKMLRRSISAQDGQRLTSSVQNLGRAFTGGTLKSILSCHSDSSSEASKNHPYSAITSPSSDGVEGLTDANYVPVNMAFIFRSGKIALIEFTESYVVRTRESQCDRYDYSKIIDVTKSEERFVITILTIFDRLIKVVI